MDLIIQILLLVLGFVLLVKGADWFVDSAAGIAGKLKVPELIIGLTVVAFGTSAPELSVSITSAFQNASSLTIGNVIGSNIMNIVLILGLTAVLCVIPVHKNSLAVDLPVMLLATVIFIVLGCIGNSFCRIDGIVMFSLLIAYLLFLTFYSLKHRTEEEKEEEEESGWFANMKKKIWFLIILFVLGLVMIIYGSDFVVNSATFIADKMGISQRIIGLTVVAIGTSLPELVTSVTAARKGKTDIAVGNIVGSNICNILCVAGFTSILRPLAFTGFFKDSLIALAAAVLLCILCYLPGNKIKKWGGVVMLVCFVGYTVSLL